LKNDNILNEAKLTNLNFNKEIPVNEDTILDRITNLDSEYFDNKASSLHKSNLIKETINEEKKETVSLRSAVNISFNNGKNGIASSSRLETNENQNQSSSVVMRKIVLLEPEIKTKKDENSLDMSNDSKYFIYDYS